MKDTINHWNAVITYYPGDKVLFNGQEIIIESEGVQNREALLKLSIKQLKNQRDSLVVLLKELLDNEDVSFYPGAIESGTKGINLEEWEVKARALISEVTYQPR